MGIKKMYPTTVAVLAWIAVVSGADPAKSINSAEELAAARKQMIGSIPATQPGVFEETPHASGEYVYEVTSARPVIEGDSCVLESDKIVKGLTVARLEGVTPSTVSSHD